MSEVLSRREFSKLTSKLLIGALTIGVVGGREAPHSIFASELAALQRAAKPYQPQKLTPNMPPRREQLAIRSNERLQQLGHNATCATVVVHPGYLRPWVTDTLRVYSDMTASLYPIRRAQEAMDRRELHDRITFVQGREGNYGNYLATLQRVFAHAHNNPSDPFIVYRQLSDAQSRWQDAALKIPEHAITIVTEQDDPSPRPTVHYSAGRLRRTATEPQDVMFLYDSLKRAGITTVRLAGENGLSRGGGIYPACAGAVTEDLQQRGFTVHGYDHAVFPTDPLDLPTSPELLGGVEGGPYHGAMAKALYFDTVQLPA